MCIAHPFVTRAIFSFIIIIWAKWLLSYFCICGIHIHTHIYWHDRYSLACRLNLGTRGKLVVVVRAIIEYFRSAYEWRRWHSYALKEKHFMKQDKRFEKEKEALRKYIEYSGNITERMFAFGNYVEHAKCKLTSIVWNVSNYRTYFFHPFFRLFVYYIIRFS